MDAIRDTYLPRYIRERWASGGVVGGDSAGGMIFPQDILISGPADLTSIVAGRTKTATGIGLVPRSSSTRIFSNGKGSIGLSASCSTTQIGSVSGQMRERPSQSGGGGWKSSEPATLLCWMRGRDKISRLQDGQASNGRDVKMQVLTHGMTLDLGDAAPRP